MSLNTQRRQRFLATVLAGDRFIRTAHDAEVFVDALCDQKDHLSAISRLQRSPDGFLIARKAMMIDLDFQALNGYAARFILHFTVDDVAQAHGGQALQELLTAITSPPMLWTAYKTAASAHQLREPGLKAFGSLILHLLLLLPPSSPHAVDLELKLTARALIDSRALHDSVRPDVRSLAHRIDDILRFSTLPDGPTVSAIARPGGRHDNDLDDFRQISIFPTKDELLSKDFPFMLTMEQVMQVSTDKRIAAHLDNQFRLLREDMLAELREDLKSAISPVTGRRRPLHLRNMQFTGINCGGVHPRPAAVAMRCFDKIFQHLPTDEPLRRKHFAENKSFIRHGSFGCLLINNEVVAFATIEREEDMLAKSPPVILLKIIDAAALPTTLTTLKLSKPHMVSFVLIDTPHFAYEPVLKCLQTMPTLPLADTILNLKEQDGPGSPPFPLAELINRIRSMEGQDISSLIGSSSPICLDHAQTNSLVAALKKPVCLIQGPPGTGKSLIGAIAVKLLLQYAPEATILILCYTNHALDQFLEDLVDIGVAPDVILRLGSKSTDRTQSMLLRNNGAARARLPQAQWDNCRFYKSDASNSSDETARQGAAFSRWKQSALETLESLNCDIDDWRFYEALLVPKDTDDMAIVGKGGKAIDALYLYDRWCNGLDAGIFKEQVALENQAIWDMSRRDRHVCVERWTRRAALDKATRLADEMQSHDDKVKKWNSASNNRVTDVMATKRIIGCTTTAAAKYADQLTLAKPEILLVEEAGEILESHILTSLSRDTKQLILIGDHFQLRPKVKNYELTVERGDGYDLNRSLFERLVLSGHQHSVLAKQHRMRPQISVLVRRLMYPELKDGENVFEREDLRGTQSNVIFIDHNHHEANDDRLKDALDNGASLSRQNVFEAKMVLKIVKYLAQQGYGSSQQVVLTPYLGQLRLIMDELKGDHDPVLGDLDSHDLVKAGLLTTASANLKKGQLRVSTIDNFQGEESDIVIASLTRSNRKSDIGFMCAPQRLNVLLSRARNGLILIGNADTFRNSRQGSSVWTPFFEQLVRNGHFFAGMPTKCEQHPQTTHVLITPQDFDTHCPSGGCIQPCGARLSCGKHKCPEHCHQLVDHSKMQCEKMVDVLCRHKHLTRRPCWQSAAPCSKCVRDQKLQQIRQQRQDEYLRKLIALEDQIATQQGAVQDLEDQVAHATTLQSKREELDKTVKSAQQRKVTLNATAARLKKANQQKTVTNLMTKEPSDEMADNGCEATKAWHRQKQNEGAENPHIDAIMRMIGLEAIKQEVLGIKDKIDTFIRQGAEPSEERFNALLLGNPGTGKTTVARHYAKCLASMGVVAGDKVEESSASKLMHGGVQAYKKLVDDVLNDGGGAIFIDEAYQLTSQGASSGTAVLDAVMDDAENLKGKVIFILAGYRKEMETLLSHNPGLNSRFPYTFNFEDYDDDQLLRIFQQRVRTRYRGRMQLESGADGLFARIVARRVGYGRGRPGFGNARAIENALAKVATRQAARLSQERRDGKAHDDLLLTKIDMLGPEPSDALQRSKAWTDLQKLIGLESVKQSIRALMQSVKFNYDRELREEPLVQFNLNRVFLGSPGTGKTTVAKLYGQVLSDLGLLSNGEVIVKNPSDFVGNVLGASEKTTKGILASTVGKVLVIDEAYGLHSSPAAQSGDIYKTAVIDTLVAEIQSVPGDDRCVLLLGYQDQMENMLRSANPGLARRFPISEAFHFEDFTDDELLKVVNLKLTQQAYIASHDAIQCIMATLRRARNSLNFGNAGEVDIILNRAKERHQQRLNKDGLSHSSVFEACDIDSAIGQAQVSITDLFTGTVGNEELKKRLQSIKNTVTNMTAMDLDPRPHVPYNFVFCGPPGTGKTSTARKMGRLYKAMGILASDEVLEKSASDMIGQYVGHTADKTKKLFESALGKVLLIDEAYRLAEGHFAKEATDEMVDLLTKPQFNHKLVVILAGYDHDIEQLMSVNPGLTSRFPEKVAFESFSPQACSELLVARLGKAEFLDTTAIKSLSSSHDVNAAFEMLTGCSGWANARDVGTVAENVIRQLLQTLSSSTSKTFIVEPQHILHQLNTMIAERRRRATFLHPAVRKEQHDQQVATVNGASNHSRETQASCGAAPAPPTATCNEQSDIETNLQLSGQDSVPQRDPGVPDEVWTELSADKVRAMAEDRHYEIIVKRCMELDKQQSESGEESSDESSTDDDDDEVIQAARAARLRREQERVRYERLRREKEEMEIKRKHELKMQQKLRLMGVCSAGFQWIKQENGYRCAGGSHFIDNATLNRD